MPEIGIARCCDNCLHRGGASSVDTCGLINKATHRLETCKQWLGNGNSIVGIENYMNSVRGHVSYKEKGEVVYRKIYTDDKEEARELRDVFKDRKVFIINNNIKTYFAKSCSTCTFSEGGKAVRHCNMHNDEIHKYEVCNSWNENESIIKRLQNNKMNSQRVY